MNDSLDAPPPKIIDGRRYSPVWLVPLAALLFGAWILYSHFSTAGTEIEIRFATADGIEPGKTKLVTRNVQVGMVTDVVLDDNLESVTVTALVDKHATKLLQEDASFWVVRPRVEAGGISGLGTVLSGAYIEVLPGKSDRSAREFKGLEQAPVLASSQAGLRFKLKSTDQAMLHVNQSISFQGRDVGKIEAVQFDPLTQVTTYSAFIEKPFDSLVGKNTRFWRTDAVRFSTSVDGIALSIGSLESLISGGITFGVPAGEASGAKVGAGQVFDLHPSARQAMEPRYAQFATFVALVDTSVRGIEQGAPVMFKGVQVGEVLSAGGGLTPVALTRNQGIPVTFSIQPARLGLADDAQGKQAVRRQIDQGLRQGLVARIESGNLITGKKLIALDFKGGSRRLASFAGLRAIPVVDGDAAQIPVRVNAVLAKIERLPLDKTIAQANASLAQVAAATRRLESLLADQNTREIPANLNQTLAQAEQTLAGLSPESEAYRELSQSLDELQRTLQDLQPVLRRIDEKPNALIFGAPQNEDIQPRRKQN